MEWEAARVEQLPLVKAHTRSMLSRHADFDAFTCWQGMRQATPHLHKLTESQLDAPWGLIPKQCLAEKNAAEPKR